jgi:carbonic anhydrase
MEIDTDYKWQIFPDERAIGIGPKSGNDNMGSFVFVKDWAMYNFDLKKILFRANSEHTLNGNHFDVEMQLVHSIDTNYYPPGKRVNLGVDFLVISIFFQITDNNNPARTKLFDFSNLKDFSNMSRKIKLWQIIQHQPSYLYQGSLTYPECEPALWMIFSQFHLISQSDFNLLLNKIQQNNLADQTTKNNVRNIFNNDFSTVYRNWNELTKMSANPTLLTYNASSYINFSFVTIVAIIFSMIMILF